MLAPGPKPASWWRPRPFYTSRAWRELVRQLIRLRGRRCEGCSKSGPVIGDHIRELNDGGAPLDPANVQLLCATCHQQKTAAARAARR